MKRFLLFLLVICLLTTMIAGCTIDISVIIEGLEKETEPEFTGYQKSATIIISHLSDATSISQSDFETVSKFFPNYIAYIESDAVKQKVLQQFPGAEFTVSVEHIDGSEICRIIVVSEVKEDLAEICNAVARYACEGLEQTIEGISCSIVDLAR